MIDLTPFYNPEDWRAHISHPMSDDLHTYATDGRILVRVPRREDVSVLPFAKRIADALEQYACGDRPWFEIPLLPPKINKRCEECEHGCSECNKGWAEVIQSVDVGNALLQRKYLAMIAALPSARISPNGKNPAWFTFDGGEGLLSAMTRRAP